MSIDYDSLVVSLTSRFVVVPFNKFSGLLLTHEQTLQKHALVAVGSPSSSFPSSLNYSTSGFTNTPQANLTSSFQNISLLGPPPTYSTNEFMA
jgi:hypothetical protein